jgi:hypothetical protein
MSEPMLTEMWGECRARKIDERGRAWVTVSVVLGALALAAALLVANG